MRKYQFTIFADYFQFDLLDDGASAPQQFWDPKSIRDRVSVAPKVIGICTARNMNVPVIVEIHDSPSDYDIDQEATDAWDHVAECGIEILSGRLVILGNEYYPDAPRIPLSPGVYKSRVYYAGLSILSEDGLSGGDLYRITLQLGSYREPTVIKRFDKA